jgi:hypothetical protein
VRYLLGVGLATVVATAGTGAAWLWEDHVAADIDQRRRSTYITPAELQDYETALSRRDAWSTATWVTGGIAAALLVATAAVYYFDMPAVKRADAP